MTAETPSFRPESTSLTFGHQSMNDTGERPGSRHHASAYHTPGWFHDEVSGACPRTANGLITDNDTLCHSRAPMAQRILCNMANQHVTVVVNHTSDPASPAASAVGMMR